MYFPSASGFMSYLDVGALDAAVARLRNAFTRGIVARGRVAREAAAKNMVGVQKQVIITLASVRFGGHRRDCYRPMRTNIAADNRARASCNPSQQLSTMSAIQLISRGAVTRASAFPSKQILRTATTLTAGTPRLSAVSPATNPGPDQVRRCFYRHTDPRRRCWSRDY